MPLPLYATWRKALLWGIAIGGYFSSTPLHAAEKPCVLVVTVKETPVEAMVEQLQNKHKELNFVKVEVSRDTGSQFLKSRIAQIQATLLKTIHQLIDKKVPLVGVVVALNVGQLSSGVMDGLANCFVNVANIKQAEPALFLAIEYASFEDCEAFKNNPKYNEEEDLTNIKTLVYQSLLQIGRDQVKHPLAAALCAPFILSCSEKDPREPANRLKAEKFLFFRKKGGVYHDDLKNLDSLSKNKPLNNLFAPLPKAVNTNTNNDTTPTDPARPAKPWYKNKNKNLWWLLGLGGAIGLVYLGFFQKKPKPKKRR